jgi:hypothetical protein
MTLDPRHWAPVPAEKRLNKPLDALCGARMTPDSDDVCVLAPGHVGLHKDAGGDCFAGDARCALRRRHE